MKRQLLAAVLSGLVLVTAAPADKVNKSDKDRLQGTWVLRSVEINGQPVAMDQLKNSRLVIKGDAYDFTWNDRRTEFTFKAEPGTTPKAIDLTVNDGPQKGKTYHAIYKLDGDTYTVCRSVNPGKDRPAEFATAPNSELMLTVWTRVAPQQAAIDKEAARFQGTWKFVSMEVDGKMKPDQDFSKYTAILKGDQWTVFESGKIAAKVTFKLDPAKSPKTIDLIDMAKKRLIRGIYSLDGDQLTLCDRGEEKGGRPTEFVSTPDSGLVLVVLRRVSP